MMKTTEMLYAQARKAEVGERLRIEFDLERGDPSQLKGGRNALL